MRLLYASGSDVGRRRRNNEDDLLVYPEERVFAVFDGMGGHAAGEVASALAASEVREYFSRTAGATETGAARCVASLQRANERILEASALDGAKRNMGTTAVLLHFEEQGAAGPEALIAHVGDSRAYHFSGGRLTRATVDHSLVEEYLRLGKLTEEEAKHFPQRNVILRALGQQRIVDVELGRRAARPGDVFLVCSDGLSGMIDDGEMESILRANAGIEEAVRALVDTANGNGGADNITVVLVQVQPD
ncbi:MAG: protein phosphatase 2C domain-containing protein [Myxococcales bacterium]